MGTGWHKNIEWGKVDARLTEVFPQLKAELGVFLQENSDWGGLIEPHNNGERMHICVGLWLKDEARPKRTAGTKPTIHSDEVDFAADFVGSLMNGRTDLKAVRDGREARPKMLDYRISVNYDFYRK